MYAKYEREIQQKKKSLSLFTEIASHTQTYPLGDFFKNAMLEKAVKLY